MNSNTQDPFVPKLNRHKFTPQEEQPVFDFESQEAFGKNWTGYILVEEDIPNATLQIGADDNASVTLTAFPDKVAEVTPVEGAVYGGGPFRLSPAIVLTDVLKKGYYRISISYTNVEVHPTWRNVAILKVLLNGEQVTVGDLKAYNLLTSEQSQAILNNYAPYNYDTMEDPSQVWAAIGGWLQEAYIEEDARNQDDDPSNDTNLYYNTCALRLSIALSSSGYNLEGAPGANNILSGNSSILGGMQHVILSANSMDTFLTNTFGLFDYSFDDYDLETNIRGMISLKNGDIFIFSDGSHVGVATFTNGFIGNHNLEPLWLIHRSSWAEPLNN